MPKPNPKPTVTLGEFIPLEEFQCPKVSQFFMRLPVDLYLPTRVTVTKPTLVAPRVARVFSTDLRAFDGKGWTIRDLDLELDSRPLDKPKSERGDVVLPRTRRPLKDYPQVLLYEVWVDDGSHDRNPPYTSLVGYVFVSDEDYPLPEDRVYPTELSRLGEW